jgi:hypothetical protein
MVELKAGEVLRGDQGLEIKLIKEIGEGSFAKVFEAVETESQLIVAAKFFNEVCVCVCVCACVCVCVCVAGGVGAFALPEHQIQPNRVLTRMFQYALALLRMHTRRETRMRKGRQSESLSRSTSSTLWDF